MEQKKKVLALLVSVGVLAGGGIGYIWFSEKSISQEVAQKIEEQLETQPATNSGAINDFGEEIAYVADIEGTVKINRNWNESLLLKNTILRTGDKITSDSGSVLTIQFVDHSFLRIEENTKFTLTSESQVELVDGWIWARILTPPDDEAAFTIKTTNFAAAVRGTAVFAQKTESETSLEVIDSSTQTGTAVDVTVQTASGILMEELKEEESLKISQNTQKKVKMNMDQLLQRENIKNYLKMDILFMNQLLNISKQNKEVSPLELQPIGTDQLQKIRVEILASLPKNNELEEFFLSWLIENDARQLDMFSGNFSGSTQVLSQEEQVDLLIEFIAGDMELAIYQKNLKKMRELENNFSSEAEKIEYQKQVNELETKIRDFDENWSKKERLRRENENTELSRSSESSGTWTNTNSSSGSLDNPSTGSGFRVPNNQPNYQGGMLDVSSPKVPSSGTQKTTASGSQTLTPSTIVSGVARPKVEPKGETKVNSKVETKVETRAPATSAKPIVSGTARPSR